MRAPGECRNATDVSDVARSLFGRDDLHVLEGVIHVTAVWQEPAGGLRTMRINAAAPRSAHDAFALGLARARADAIIVTGRVLRDEPALRYELAPDAELAAALGAWRRERAGREKPPALVVLTSGEDVPLDHPALSGPMPPVIFTGPGGARSVGCAHGIEVVAVEEPSLRGALAFFRGAREARTVLIEAGPSTTRGLYEPPLAIDELMLSVFHAPSLAAEARGHEFHGLDFLAGALGAPAATRNVIEPSGPWSFRSLRR